MSTTSTTSTGDVIAGGTVMSDRPRRSLALCLALLGCAAAPRAATRASATDAATPEAPRSNDASADDAGDADDASDDAGGGDAGAAVADAGGSCPERRAEEHLIRANYNHTPGGLRRAVRERTERYGYFAPFGERAWNAQRPDDAARWTTFMGLRVRLHQRVHGPLQCVEQAIRRDCAATPYQPTRLQGIRGANSFRGGEVSNHVYGIAIDIDPQRNPCCGCGRMFRDHPGCRRRARSVFERMEMPECWVRAFERNGFYWLGADPDLRDLMHFEFLARPPDPPQG